ncbi:hypothetical protein JMF97_28760 [Micromonospora fiedleri]|uniref:Uncharacterized protein n=1 Tax=Micromonospora fiedleri TaxID=1157498 RepID=A0ABS1UUW8_9ACTN|nr:hypothetical protein [Micromonospora fiedleri]MBL6280160.1 hypothetical protein [Micromonospora fiedleri]
MTLIYPTDREDAGRLARQLLDAAGPERHDEVRTNTDGALGLAFDVPDDIADAVLGTGEGRVVQPSLDALAGAEADNASTEGGEESALAEVGGESAPADSGEETAPAVAGEESAPAEVGEGGASVVAGADVSEVDAKPVDGSSPPPGKAARSRSSRSR